MSTAKASAYTVEVWDVVPPSIGESEKRIGALAPQMAPISPRAPSVPPQPDERAAPGEMIAVARSYEDLVAACALRRNELKLAQLVVDEIAGFQTGYTGKLECGDKRLGAMSMPCLLQALGLELVVVRTVPHHERSLRRAD